MTTATAPVCRICGGERSRKSESGLCKRCSNHARSAKGYRPSEAQRMASAVSRTRLSTLKAPTPTGCPHRWVISDAVPGDGIQEGVCSLCHETREFRPWATEIASVAPRPSRAWMEEARA